MYSVKRFSNLRDKIFSKSLSDIRKRSGDYESSISAHLLMFLTLDEINEYWIHEITRFISDKIKDLDKKFVKNFDYELMFPYYIGNNQSIKNSTISQARKKIIEDNEVSIRYSVKYLDSDILKNTLSELVYELNKLKYSLNRTIDLSKDEDEMNIILTNLYNKYHDKLK